VSKSNRSVHKLAFEEFWTQLCAWHDSFMCVPWLIHMCTLFTIWNDWELNYDNVYLGSVWHGLVVCCSVLQCVAVCCSVLQCVAVCCCVLQCDEVCSSVLLCVVMCCNAYLIYNIKSLRVESWDFVTAVEFGEWSSNSRLAMLQQAHMCVSRTHVCVSNTYVCLKRMLVPRAHMCVLNTHVSL